MTAWVSEKLHALSEVEYRVVHTGGWVDNGSGVAKATVDLLVSANEAIDAFFTTEAKPLNCCFFARGMVSFEGPSEGSGNVPQRVRRQRLLFPSSVH